MNQVITRDKKIGLEMAANCNANSLTLVISVTITQVMKKRSERRKHCALAVVRRSQKISPRTQCNETSWFSYFTADRASTLLMLFKMVPFSRSTDRMPSDP